VASENTLNFISSYGFICNATVFHEDDPLSASGTTTYGSEIDKIITANGFFPIPYGPEGDGTVTGTKVPSFSDSNFEAADVTPSTSPANNGDNGYCRVAEGS
jgi:hypothetical protein